MRIFICLLFIAGGFATTTYAQNVGIGTNAPINKLQVEGSFLVTTPTTATSAEPTATQTRTMIHSSAINYGSGDSTGRIYDPGGPSGNYAANQNSAASVNQASNVVGIEFTIEYIVLHTGDSLIVKDGLLGNTLVAVGNFYNTPGKWIFNSSTLFIFFKSNSDANVAVGFSLLFRRLYAATTTQPYVGSYAGNALFFDTKNGAFRSGLISNDIKGDNSTALGYNTTASGDHSTALGYNTTASGNRSTAMGSYVSTNNLTGSFVIGDNSTLTVMNAANDNNFRARFAGGYKLFTSANLTTGCTLFAGDNAWTIGSDVRSKENFAEVNGEDVLKKIARFHLTSWNYKTQDPSKFRHYGPMAQEFHAAFGKDQYGSIGNDTTINQADFDGVNLIAIQALEKRTTEQQQTILELKKDNSDLKAMVLELRRELDALLKRLNEKLQQPL